MKDYFIRPRYNEWRDIMKDRREFLKRSILLAGGAVLYNSGKAFASGTKSGGRFPAGIVYTRQNPGKWAAKKGSHAPEVSVKGKKVTITTVHPMMEKHYIVRHTLVSADGKVLGEKTFYPFDPKAESTYELPERYTSTLYATSFCNLHDFWVTEFKV